MLTLVCCQTAAGPNAPGAPGGDRWDTPSAPRSSWEGPSGNPAAGGGARRCYTIKTLGDIGQNIVAATGGRWPSIS